MISDLERMQKMSLQVWALGSIKTTLTDLSQKSDKMKRV